MKYMPGFTMDDFYVNDYGYDSRELDFAQSFVRYSEENHRCFHIEISQEQEL